ncbi:L,D-transpeptidase [Klebsiella michiganensis]|uniref:L,D-transpeptidase n=1 Tax=Klebsiella michiganensis TaxID=1134687 RepID=A0A7H4N3A1_9ENTR|nr:L,D-transpeptidase [Klebsiella michiganensis]
MPVGTRVEFIDEPVKATTEPDGSRFIEVHNPLSTTEEQFQGGEIVPINLTKSVQAITSQTDVDQSVVDQAIQNRSGMPVASELKRIAQSGGPGARHFFIRY